MAELDPHGKDPHAPGAKLDDGKLDFEIILEYFPEALEAVARVAMFGEIKYTRGGWRHVLNGIRRYRNAGHRHDLKRAKGETYDKDSKLHHVAHKAWNALAELELVLAQQELKTETQWATPTGEAPVAVAAHGHHFPTSPPEVILAQGRRTASRDFLVPSTWFKNNRKK